MVNQVIIVQIYVINVKVHSDVNEKKMLAGRLVIYALNYVRMS